jgi:hypothetical protein
MHEMRRLSDALRSAADALSAAAEAAQEGTERAGHAYKEGDECCGHSAHCCHHHQYCSQCCNTPLTVTTQRSVGMIPASAMRSMTAQLKRHHRLSPQRLIRHIHLGQRIRQSHLTHHSRRIPHFQSRAHVHEPRCRSYKCRSRKCPRVPLRRQYRQRAQRFGMPVGRRV